MCIRDSHEIKGILLQHLNALHAFYGEFMGVKIARKHVGWYLQATDNNAEFRKHFNQLESAELQSDAIENYFQLILEQDNTINKQGSVSKDRPATINKEVIAA